MISPGHIMRLHKSETSEDDNQILGLKIKNLSLIYLFLNIGIKRLAMVQKTLGTVRPQSHQAKMAVHQIFLTLYLKPLASSCHGPLHFLLNGAK